MTDTLPPMMSEEDFARYTRELILWFKDRNIHFEDMTMMCCSLVGTSVGAKVQTENRLAEGLAIMTEMIRVRALQTMLALSDMEKASHDRTN